VRGTRSRICKEGGWGRSGHEYARLGEEKVRRARGFADWALRVVYAGAQEGRGPLVDPPRRGGSCGRRCGLCGGRVSWSVPVFRACTTGRGRSMESRKGALPEGSDRRPRRICCRNNRAEGFRRTAWWPGPESICGCSASKTHPKIGRSGRRYFSGSRRYQSASEHRVIPVIQQAVCAAVGRACQGA
jgi:hypothetical protein